MELNELKSTWNTLNSPDLSKTDILNMLSENKHPVLKSIRKQLIIELVGWTIFLLCYYSMFDGNTKPLWVNALLILSILLPAGHNLMGYNFAKHLIYGVNIHQSLQIYLSKIKVYAASSIITRQIYLTGILLFFGYGLNIGPRQHLAFAIIGLVFSVQLIMTTKIWRKRIRKLKESLAAFN
ncbi:hypothetical protein [Sphingobacterium sp. SYP-B4668]|uniref:hypothetical protein n=1 Tax=Sphingobacterium sp. SYP-B4668 TaxID=2996035 RepID=UPI0022DD5F26|nr:hypothetical protein [Sphingobacterium sp. SYP-B4668]